MTLNEMSDYVTSKVNQTEDEDVLACKEFIRRRYETIWGDQLWKDSLAQAAISVDPTTNADHAVGVIPMPEIIDRVVAIRSSGSRPINVNPLELYYRLDLDLFLRTGSAYEMALLNPAWLTVRPNADYWVAASLVSGTPTHYVLTAAVGSLVRFTNNTSQECTISDSVVGDIAQVAVGGTAYVLVANTPLSFDFAAAVSNPKQAYIGGTLLDNQSPGASSTVTITSSSGADTSAIKVIWRDLTGKRYETTGPLPMQLIPDDDAGHFEIEAIFKQTTTGTITATLLWAGGQGSAVLGTIAPTATRTPAYQRVRLFDIPSGTSTLRVAGKIKCQSLTFGNEEPLLTDCEDILLAFAQGDMLERERQYGKAKEKFTEAVALLEELKRIEVVQQARNARIEPETGYGSEWDFNQNNLLTF